MPDLLQRGGSAPCLHMQLKFVQLTENSTSTSFFDSLSNIWQCDSLSFFEQRDVCVLLEVVHS